MSELSDSDHIDELVDWQLRKHPGTSVCRPMFQVIDIELGEEARWTPSEERWDMLL